MPTNIVKKKINGSKKRNQKKRTQKMTGGAFFLKKSQKVPNININNHKEKLRNQARRDASGYVLKEKMNTYYKNNPNYQPRKAETNSKYAEYQKNSNIKISTPLSIEKRTQLFYNILKKQLRQQITNEKNGYIEVNPKEEP
jgi:hypothetical protein